MRKNIVLIGFMATGKSLTSIELAKQRNMDRVSTDDVIIRQEGRPIAEIFGKLGEAHFRRLENEAVKGIAQKTNTVIDCGGGIVLNPDNIRLLKQNGIVICLSSSPEAIYRRVKGKAHRPLLNTDDPEVTIRKLLDERKPHYNQADFTVDTSDLTIGETVEKIIQILKEKEIEETRGTES
jgi:shikimate kinase